MIIGCIGALMLCACTSMKQKETMEKMYLMVGSYATPEEEGIKVYAWLCREWIYPFRMIHNTQSLSSHYSSIHFP